MIRTILLGLAGAAVMYFLDPDRGRRRRAMAVDRTAATVRRAAAVTERAQRKVVSDAYGVGQKAAHPGAAQEPPANDAALAQKVMTDLFRDQRIPKGSINVNAENGIVQLRGQVEHPEEILEIEGRVRRIPGVVDVRTLLHLPGSAVRTS